MRYNAIDLQCATLNKMYLLLSLPMKISKLSAAISNFKMAAIEIITNNISDCGKQS